MTKPYTLNEAIKLPFGTKFRLPWWSKGEYIYFKRTDEGSVSIFTDQNMELVDGHIGTTNYYFLQDQFTVVDCKHPSKKWINIMSGTAYFKCNICGEDVKTSECVHSATTPYEFMNGKKICHYCKNSLRAYVSRAEALENVATGKWDRAVYDSDGWRAHNGYLLLKKSCEGEVFLGTAWMSSTYEACRDESDARWYNPDEGEK